MMFGRIPRRKSGTGIQAGGPGCMAEAPDSEGNVAGFWMGLWHGFASPVMFIISLFNKSVEVYEVHNNGAWYTFGFLIGAGAILGGSGDAAMIRISGRISPVKSVN